MDEEDLEFALKKQREEVMAAAALDETLAYCFQLQMEEAMAASVALQTSDPRSTVDVFKPEVEETRYTDLLLGDLDLFEQDRLLVKKEIDSSMLELDLRSHDRTLAKEYPWQNLSKKMKKKKTFAMGESARGTKTYDEVNYPILELSLKLGEAELILPEVAELTALVHGLSWALDIGMGRIIIYCEQDSTVFNYVTGISEPKESTAATLLEEVAQLRSRFSSCQAVPLRTDDSFVLRLAKAAIVSQIRWIEGNISYETCTLCYEHVESDLFFAVPRCFHRFCNTCMGRHVSSLTDRGDETASCPGLNCKSELQLEDCVGIVEPKKLAVMIQRKKRVLSNSKTEFTASAPNVPF
ncbi:unnamed protein product [Cochlearia groenlandica]